jgi:dTDP-4-dehydrorhamnose reductase
MAEPVLTALVLGARGQVGHELHRAVAQGLGQDIARHWVWADRQQCDLAHPEQIAPLLDQWRPGLILNAAAYTAVDRAESEPDLARCVNADAVAELAAGARRLGAVLVHYSTDYVFDGQSDRPYVESDLTGPQSVYGHTKLAGEQAVREGVERHLVLRTSWVFGRHGGNFLKTMLRLGLERDELRVVADQWGAPTSAQMLARQTLLACRQALNPARAEQAVPWGLYHLTCAGHTHWHAYAMHVLQRARQWGAPLRVTPERILPIATEQYPTPARRPLNSRLNCDLWQSTWQQVLPDWQTEVDQVLADVLLDQGVLTPAKRETITSARSDQ